MDLVLVFFSKRKTAYEMRISDWSSDVCSSDLRVPAIDAEQLDRAGVAHDKGRLSLNEFLQSRTNPLVYAAGDAAQMAPPLTPVASRDGEVVAVNMLEGNHRTADYGPIPSVV